MILSLEDLLERDSVELAQFTEDVRDVTSTAAGRRMIATLVGLAHPFRTPMRETERETCVAIGRKEVVALLWERSAAQEFNPYSKTPGKTA